MSTRSRTALAVRSSLVTAIVAGIASLAIAAAPVVAAGDQAAVGWWQLTIATGGPQTSLSLVTLAADGTAVVADTPVGSDAQGNVTYASAGHGAWQADGKDGFALTFVEMNVDGEGSLVYIVTIDVQGTVNGDAMSGSFVGTATGPDGSVFGNFPGTLTGTRITVQPMPSMAPAGPSMMPAASASPPA